MKHIQVTASQHRETHSNVHFRHRKERVTTVSVQLEEYKG